MSRSTRAGDGNPRIDGWSDDETGYTYGWEPPSPGPERVGLAARALGCDETGHPHDWLPRPLSESELKRVGARAKSLAEARQSGPLSCGLKHDQGKPTYDLIAPEFLDGLAQVLAHGAAKYEPRNWEKGLTWGRVFAAAMRHMWAWWRGETNDPDTGLSHLSHAACNLMFLATYQARGMTGFDDRALFKRPIPNHPGPDGD